eukprot:10710832-Heterocapsa_arctica.AAC.1
MVLPASYGHNNTMKDDFQQQLRALETVGHKHDKQKLDKELMRILLVERSTSLSQKLSRMMRLKAG